MNAKNVMIISLFLVIGTNSSLMGMNAKTNASDKIVQHRERQDKESKNSEQKATLLKTFKKQNRLSLSAYSDDLQRVQSPAKSQIFRPVQRQVSLFELAHKVILSEGDMKKVVALVENPQALLVTNHDGKTIRQVLEDFLNKYARDAVDNVPNPQSINSAKKYLDLAMEDEVVAKNIIPYWQYIADSATTALLLKSLYGRDGAQKFVDGLIRFVFDPVPVKPRRAQVIYERCHFLSEKEKVTMLFHYLYRYRSSSTNDFASITSSRGKSTRDQKSIVKYDVQDVVTALYFLHRDLFLSFSPEETAINYTRDFATPAVKVFLDRVDKLARYVTLSILKRKSKEIEAAQFWKGVALGLLEAGDLFGYTAVKSGLDSHKIKSYTRGLKLSDLEETTDHKVHKTKKKEFKRVVIPHLAVEGGQFTTHLQHLPDDKKERFLASGGRIAPFPLRVSEFVNEVTATQEALRATMTGKGPKRKHLKRLKMNDAVKELMLRLKNLPRAETSSRALQLLALNQKARSELNVHALSPDAATWTGEDLNRFLTMRDFSEEDIADIGKYFCDGGSMLHALACCKNEKEESLSAAAHKALRSYESYCRDVGEKPFASRLRSQSSSSKLFSENAPAHWLFWLRNNGLGATVNTLYKHDVDNFKSFLEMRARFESEEEFYDRLGIKEQDIRNRFEHLVKLHNHTDHQPAELDRWTNLDLESWLFAHIKDQPVQFAHDNVSEVDYFLAYFYVWELLKSKKFVELNLKHDLWNVRIFEIFAQQHTMLDGETKKRLAMVHPHKHTSSFLYWIAWLERNNLRDTIAPFINRNIHSFSDLVTATEQHGNSIGHFFRDIGIVDKKPQKKLKKVLKTVNTWRLPHIQSWMKIHKLDYLIDDIKADGFWDADSFLSAFYVYQKFSGQNVLNLDDKGWFNLVFDRLSGKHDIVWAVDHLAHRAEEGADIKKPGRLNFIIFLARHRLLDRLPDFYQRGIVSYDKIPMVGSNEPLTRLQ